MSEPSSCAICGAHIDGVPFTVIALTEPPRPLEVCETCAGSQYVRLRYDDLDLEVFREDYTRADPGRLSWALDRAAAELAEQGWTLEGVKLQAASDLVTEPCDD